MTELDVLSELESLGTEQHRKIYRRHGISDPMYGVSYANLEKLRKRIKKDHELAENLWASGNHDARILAMMIADPKQANDRLLESWSKDLNNYTQADAFAKYTDQAGFARKKMEKWSKSKKEWTERAGWTLVSYLARNDKELSNDFFEGYLEIIERDIHSSRNWTKEAMNSALISIGIRNSILEKKAIAAARRIGNVEIDHGETGCKTPDAVEYILKAAKRRR
jgi:3-methyladenine DNA glycosylase AlkD